MVDDLPDAANPEGRRFHTRRVVAALRSAWPGPLRRTLAHLLAEVEMFRAGAELVDDHSLLLLHHHLK
jgi:hypothetical protein